MIFNKNKKKHINFYHTNGYVLLKNFLNKNECLKAALWLNRQKQEKFANSWTEQEPGVPLAVFFSIHRKKTPLSKLVNNKKILDFASELSREKCYIYSSKVNLKKAWCGAVEYYHQDLVYWKDRGYPRHDLLSAMVFLEPHNINNAALNVIPKSHKYGFIKHEPFINLNGLSKYMIPPKTLNKLDKKNPAKIINANVGDVLFFHMALVHGSSHNISSKGRMILLSQINTINNIPNKIENKSRKFNLIRAKKELKEAERRYKWFKKKYITQLKSKKLTFHAPIPKLERK
jgi:hypothetical protein